MKYFLWFFILAFIPSLFGQQVSAIWPLTDPNNGGTGLVPVISGNLTASDEIFNNMEINQYSGYNFSQRLRIAGNEWPANQTTQLDTVFVQFSVGPQNGFKFHVDSISLNIVEISLTTIKANIYYSIDSTFSTSTKLDYSTTDPNGYLERDSFSVVKASINEVLNPNERIYLRIYPWVEDPTVRTGKYIGLQDVKISGTIESLVVQSFAFWPFETDDVPVTSGPIIAQNQTYSPAMKFYSQFTTLPGSDGSGDHTCGAIQTVSKSWYAEPTITDSLYFQYAISPKHGGSFFADSLSMYIGGWFTDKIKAEIYYSEDSSFSSKTLLIADTLLVGNAVMPLKAVFSDTVNTGETLYIRVYPHNTEAQNWAKLVAVDNVYIYGTTTGVTSDPPTVTTVAITNISTTFATSGGNIPTDGGAQVLNRGVVWNTSGNPTIVDSKTSDGFGSGSFISQIIGLSNGTTYYLRAYATNEAGTGYGEEVTFKTLDSTEVPTVTTSSVSNILVKSATSGGEVTSWGGDTVSVRGVCWNTSGNPTIVDSKTENGSGLGDFISTLYPLEANTIYYFRAYATNSIGTGYGKIDSFQTQQPSPDIVKIVSKDGSGDYTTVQAAFNDVPDFYTGQYKIIVKKGIYYEKLMLDRNKTNVVLLGEDPDSTILTFDDYAGKSGGTSNSQSVAIDADDFTAIDIVFRNTVVNDGSFNDQQAVALRVNGDRQAYYNCKLLGYQDTYYTWGGRATGRTYMKNCYIEGSVDFIFGRNVVLFDSCEIHINRNGGSLTAASTEPETMFGYVFKDCKITADAIGFNGDPITSFILGRPWQKAPRTVFINCEEPASVNPNGWATWNTTPALYAEYKCYGPGADFSNRISIGRQLTDEEAQDYTLENIFAKSTNPDFGYDWMPVNPLITYLKNDLGQNEIPLNYKLMQNYPNPFNPTTTIQFQMPKYGKVAVTVYNVLGQHISTLFNKAVDAGYYNVNFDANNLASGIYIYSFKAGEFVQTKKMMLIK